MSIFKCKMCGGTIEFEEGATVGECQHCGTKQTLPKLDDDRKTNLYDRANHFRRNNDYDKAAGIYEQILNEDPSDAEAYWSLVLCQYGIEYVEDPATHKRVPTVNRAQFTSIFDDDNYKSALQYADTHQRKIYEQEANAINEIQKGILSISQKEDPFDVFICYKETDANGRRTSDSVLANDLYHQLTQEGFKVFFARITLEDKLGTAYEPYIFAALNSAKVMVVLGTKPEYFNAVWVKNEWSRYLGLVKNSNGKKILIPAYKDMDPYDLPEEFSHLQAQDMSKLGFMQDLIRGIKKIVVADEAKSIVKEVVKETPTNASVESLLKRVNIFLEDAQWDDANTYCEKVLDIDPENAKAYLGKLMVELQVCRQEDLQNCKEPFDENNNFKKIIRFGDKEISSTLNGYIKIIRERNDNDRKINFYNSAVSEMNIAETEAAYKKVSEKFSSIMGFRNADALAAQCLAKAEEIKEVKLKQLYDSAVNAMNEAETEISYKTASEKFKMLKGYNDADILAEKCLMKAKEAKEARLKQLYDSAVDAMNKAETEDSFKEIAEKFKEIKDYKDAFVLHDKCLEKAEECQKDEIYKTARSQMSRNNKDSYELAIQTFSTIPEWKDVDAQINACKKKIEEINAQEEADRLAKEYEAEQRRIAEEKKAKKRKRRKNILVISALAGILFVLVFIYFIVPLIQKKNKYSKAMSLLDSGDYDAAYALLEEVGKSDEIKIDKHSRAIKLIDSGDYEAGYALLEEIGNSDAIASSKYDRAVALIDYGDYEAAYVLLEEIGNSDAIASSKYDRAVALIDSEDYEAAYILLGDIYYKDSASLRKTIENSDAWLKICPIGRTVFFGAYEQDNNITDGKEDIEWIVLAREGDRVLVISRYALDCQQYNTSYKSVAWENCSLRKWLNETFMNAAFSESERAMIPSMTISADKNPEYSTSSGKCTTDKVFLLSITEVNKYFSSNSVRQCQGTAYCYELDAYKDSSGNCWWWLRSPGYMSNYAAYVNFDGSVYDRGIDVNYGYVAVRPALWIDLGS